MFSFLERRPKITELNAVGEWIGYLNRESDSFADKIISALANYTKVDRSQCYPHFITVPLLSSSVSLGVTVASMIMDEEQARRIMILSMLFIERMTGMDGGEPLSRSVISEHFRSIQELFRLSAKNGDDPFDAVAKVTVPGMREALPPRMAAIDGGRFKEEILPNVANHLSNVSAFWANLIEGRRLVPR